ncbi:unnamed protein product, partial [Rotaria sordida]
HIKIITIIPFRTGSGECYARDTSGTIPTRCVLQCIIIIIIFIYETQKRTTTITNINLIYSIYSINGVINPIGGGANDITDGYTSEGVIATGYTSPGGVIIITDGDLELDINLAHELVLFLFLFI